MSMGPCLVLYKKDQKTSKPEVNVREGIYTAVVALVSLLTFSTVISFMTSLIGTLQHKRMEEKLGVLVGFVAKPRDWMMVQKCGDSPTTIYETH